MGRRSQLRRVTHTVALRGPLRTALDVVHRLTAYHPENDRSFDRRHGTDTTGRLEPATLGIADAERRDQAIVYLGSPERVTRWMLDHVDVTPTSCTFVDLGCGKGRVVMVAAARPFRAVLGIDISADLTAIARRNVDHVRPGLACRSVEIVTADVTTVDLPDGDLLLHFYHPFSTEVTRRVLERLNRARQAGRHPRVVVAYLVYSGAVAEVRDALGAVGWLHETRYEPSLTGEYDWLLYSS